MRTIADGLEWRYGRKPAVAQRRLRFLIEFSYRTGLRASETVHATLGSIGADAQGDHWRQVVGKGAKCETSCGTGPCGPRRRTCTPMRFVALGRSAGVRGAGALI